MNFFNAAKKTGADLTYNRSPRNTAQMVFEATAFIFMTFCAPLTLCLTLVIGFLAATAYNTLNSDSSSPSVTNHG
ncbi:MAG: hypothetical protein P1U61_01515 [Legionellaceae bacterium]|nr:hypothetical protein [Legionellaceae bacterium]